MKKGKRKKMASNAEPWACMRTLQVHFTSPMGSRRAETSEGAASKE